MDQIKVESQKMTNIVKRMRERVTSTDTRKCCCCFSVRGGILAWGYFKLILVFVVGISIMSMIAMNLLFDASWDTWLAIVSFVSYFATELVFTNILIVGTHTKSFRILQAYMRYSIINIIIVVAMMINFLLVPLMALDNDSPDVPILTTLICATTVYMGLNTYVILMVRFEMTRLRGGIPYNTMTEVSNGSDGNVQSEVKTVVVKTASGGYSLVTRINPGATNEPPQFLVKRLGENISIVGS